LGNVADIQTKSNTESDEINLKKQLPIMSTPDFLFTLLIFFGEVPGKEMLVATSIVTFSKATWRSNTHILANVTPSRCDPIVFSNMSLSLHDLTLLLKQLPLSLWEIFITSLKQITPRSL